MWNKGFQSIKKLARQTHLNKLKYRHINMMILRFMKVNMGDYFNKWKEDNRLLVKMRYEDASESFDSTVAYF